MSEKLDYIDRLSLNSVKFKRKLLGSTTNLVKPSLYQSGILKEHALPTIMITSICY